MTNEVLTEEAFARNVQTKFRVPLDEGRQVELELVEVLRYGAGADEQQGMERFSAFFEGPGDIFLRQATYTLEHEDLGVFQLFIVPIAKTERGFRYEAVVNRMKSKDEGGRIKDEGVAS
jgi:hypothetical protein